MMCVRLTHPRQAGRCAVSILLLLLVFAAASGCHLWAQESTLPLITAQAPNGRVVSPGSLETLTVLVTNRSGTPLGNTAVTFSAPDAGPSGSFPLSQTPHRRYMHASTQSSGVASTTFVTGNETGIFLVEVRVDGTDASTTFAFTVQETPAVPEVTAEAARAGVKAEILDGAIEDETLLLHGPVLLPAGSQVFPSRPSERYDTSHPIVTEELSWLLWIDDYPLASFAHGVRFVLLDAMGTSQQTVTQAEVSSQQWWPSVILPGDQRVLSLLPPFASELAIPDQSQALAAPVARAALETQGPPWRFAPADACAILIRGPDTDRTGGEKNIERFRQYLIDNDLVRPENILTNIDEDSGFLGFFKSHKPVSRQDVDNLISQAARRDCKKLYWLFTTHGAPPEELAGGYVSVRADSNADPDYITYEDLTLMLKRLGRIEFNGIQQSCYSGQFALWLQGLGFTGQIVTSADPHHVSYAGGAGGALTTAFVPALGNSAADVNSDGTVTFREALDHVFKTTDAGSAVQISNPEVMAIDPDGTRMMRARYVFVERSGMRKIFLIGRPSAAPTGVFEGTTRALVETVARVLPQRFSIGRYDRATLGTAIGVSNGTTEYTLNGNDSFGASYLGLNNIQVGHFRINPDPVTVLRGQHETVAVTRYGTTLDLGSPRSDTSTTLTITSRNPGIAQPTPHIENIPSRQETAQITVYGVMPGRTTLDVHDSRSNSVQSFGVIVTEPAPPPPPPDAIPDNVNLDMDFVVNYNPGFHPITLNGPCNWIKTGARFSMHCADEAWVDVQGDVDEEKRTFTGVGFGKTAFGYDVHATLSGGVWLSSGQQSQSAPQSRRTAGIDQVQFVYELGSKGGLPGGQPIRFQATGTIAAGSLDGAAALPELRVLDVPSCTYAFNPASETFTPASAIGAVTVSTQVNCPWMAISDVPWIAITAGGIGTGPGTISYLVLANQTGASRTGNIVVGGQSFAVTQSGGQGGEPIIESVVNSASFDGGPAHGAWFSIWGSNLSPTTRLWRLEDFDGNNLPTQLDGVSVTVNGRPAYVYYISETQVNALAPDEEVEGVVDVQVTTPAGVSNKVATLTRTLQPKLFMFDPENRMYVAAAHPDGTLVGKPGLFPGATTRPAKPGDYISLFGTGFGPTIPATPSGQLVSQVGVCASPVVARIGGVNAEVHFAGKVMSGLYQFNLKVPDLPDGDHQVRLYIDGYPTQIIAYVTVQN